MPLLISGRRGSHSGDHRCATTFGRQAVDGLTNFGLRFRFSIIESAALALDRKKLAAFSALGGGFLLFPIGDRRCNRTRASVGNAGGNARRSLTNATLAASRLLHRSSPTASPRAR